MRPQFPLFQSHLDLAHTYWERLVGLDDIVIDATCGTGQDSSFLARLPCSRLYLIDIQKQALEQTKERLLTQYGDVIMGRITFIEGCHSKIQEGLTLPEQSCKLIVYNLGYLPGSDKTLTTHTTTTLQSVSQALQLIKPGGAISITCYPGHPEGALEEEALLDMCEGLSPAEWGVCCHRFLNRQQAPSLLLLQRARSKITIS